MTFQKTDYAIDTIEAYKSRLSTDHFNVLVVAATCAGNYRSMVEALSTPEGTVKSRLSRARKALAALIEKDAKDV
jgi:DNA-directed RNA polymerase specialized sigma24 family protein